MNRRDFLTGSVGLTALGAAGEALTWADNPDDLDISIAAPFRLTRDHGDYVYLSWWDQRPGDRVTATYHPTGEAWTWEVTSAPDARGSVGVRNWTMDVYGVKARPAEFPVALDMEAEPFMSAFVFDPRKAHA